MNFSSSSEHIEKKEGRGVLRQLLRAVNVVKVPAIVMLIKELMNTQDHLYLMLKIEAVRYQCEGSGKTSIALTKG